MPITVTKTETVQGDSIPYPVPLKIPVPKDSIPYPVSIKIPVPKDEIVIDTVYLPQSIDTAAILSEYYEKFIYRDTVKNNDVTAILYEEITQNRIYDRKIWLQNTRAQTINTTIVEDPSARFFPGVFVSGYNGRIGLGAGLCYVRKRDAFLINVDVLNSGISAGYYVRFK